MSIAVNNENHILHFRDILYLTISLHNSILSSVNCFKYHLSTFPAGRKADLSPAVFFISRGSLPGRQRNNSFHSPQHLLNLLSKRIM